MRKTETVGKRGVLVNMLDSAFSRAIFYGTSHNELSSEVTSIIVADKRLPETARAYLRGYVQRRYNEIWSGHTFFAFVGPNGELYTSHTPQPLGTVSDKPLYGSDGFGPLRLSCRTLPSGHFWLSRDCDRVGAGPRPYTVAERNPLLGS